ncbi:MAG: hypothetical protein BroJett041_23500 [Candidatus Jettenia caeni]|nr:MAG: hypothetical protein BroJett041_23500 [Candidatus Jettenia caeni]
MQVLQFLGLGSVVLFLTNEAITNSISKVTKEIHTAYLNEIVYNFKNDLVSGNLRFFRNQISLMMAHDVFSDYEIVRNNIIVDSSDSFIKHQKNPLYDKIEVPIYFDENKLEKWGQVNLLVTERLKSQQTQAILSSISRFGGYAILFLAFITLLFFIFWQKISFSLGRGIENLFQKEKPQQDRFSELFWKPVLLKLDRLKIEHDRLVISESEAQNNLFLVTLTRRVAHDIRSPLSALNIVLTQLHNIHEDQRFLISHAIERINDIANDLLRQSKFKSQEEFVEHDQKQNQVPQNQTELIKIDDVLKNLVEEKKYEFKSQQHISILYQIGKNANGVHAKLNKTELSRHLSNLINNSVEAIQPEAGTVNVMLNASSTQVVITIQDSGRGMSEETLAKLRHTPFTEGKENTDSGSGIGVYSANKFVESFGGELSIHSRPGVGTIVTIKIPRVD